MEVHQVSLSVCLSLPHSLSLKDIQEPLMYYGTLDKLYNDKSY